MSFTIRKNATSIIIEFPISEEPETVFGAVTTRKGYQGWWAAVCDIDCRLNGMSSIRFEKENIVEEMCFRASEVEKNKRLVWICFKNNVFSSWIGCRLEFKMNPKGNGTLLNFTQTSPDDGWSGHPDYQPTLEGWSFFMESLKNYCETGKGEPWG